MNSIGFFYSNILLVFILGTVINTDIVSPNGFNFYLNSDAPTEGTAKATHYRVLYDEIGFTSDDIHELT